MWLHLSGPLFPHLAKGDKVVRAWCGCMVPSWALTICERVSLSRGLKQRGGGKGIYDPESLRALRAYRGLDLSFPTLSDGKKHLSHLLNMQIPRAHSWNSDSTGLGGVQEPIFWRSSHIVLMHNVVEKLRPRGRQ